MKPINKCKYHKYNEDNWEHICTEYGVCCKGNKIDQKKCLIAQLENKCEKYEQALEEIEKVCIEDTREFADGTTVRYDSLDEILDIIHKAKGERNE